MHIHTIGGVIMKRFLSACIVLLLCFSSRALAENIPTPAVGDTLTFGSYEQDNQTDNGKEPLEWIVLDVQDNKAMLLSKYCIDTVIFYPERVPMYWGKSDLRAWMNGDFLQEAFTPEEQALILTTTVKNDNPHGMKGAGEDTLDQVYLLSKSEVLHFFPEMADRVAYPTEYAKSKGCTVDPKTGSCRWWTRTPGARKMDICGMRLDGRISSYGMQDVDWPTNTMRPVMWVQCGE
jgi:eukaryotic-like serine/threonine-protein kinase